MSGLKRDFPTGLTRGGSAFSPTQGHAGRVDAVARIQFDWTDIVAVRVTPEENGRFTNVR